MVKTVAHIRQQIARQGRRFARAERGAALVELAVSLPLMLLLFAVIVEGGRLMWSYQATAAGVRDAARYLGRIAASDACSAGADFSAFDDRLFDIVTQTSTQNAVFPQMITITGVDSTLVCVDGDLRIDPAPVAEVTATLRIEFPFTGLFTYAGHELLTITTTVTDQSRVFGS